MPRIALNGLGRIGKAVARRCRGIEMRILAHDIQPDMAFARDHGVKLVPLERLLREADIVSLHVPRTPETENLIDRNRLALMKPTASLVNVSRGPHVVTGDLVDALREGKIAGAGLDVTDPEPLPEDHPLREMPNVVLSPHIAAHTDQVQSASYRLLFDSIRRAVNRSPAARSACRIIWIHRWGSPFASRV